jgi:hypothetical protein
MDGCACGCGWSVAVEWWGGGARERALLRLEEGAGLLAATYPPDAALTLEHDKQVRPSVRVGVGQLD